MKNMTLKAIAQACNGKLVCSEKVQDNKEITCAVLDSRKIEEGGLFIANVGANVDGHKFIGQVFEKGALGVICEKTPSEVEEAHGISQDCWGAYILVEDSLQALKEIAEFYRKQLTLPVIGITGSVGKTSTKEFIAGVLSQKYKVLKTEGNFNNEIGLPLTLLRIRREHEVAVVEMGISDFGEMHRLSKMARPDICVLTNIAQCHLENLKNREGVLKAKTEIFDFMAEDGYVCVNGADDMLASLDKVKGRKVLRFGVKNDGCECFDVLYNVYADSVESKGLFGSTALMHSKGEVTPINVPLPGAHMVINAMAAALVAELLDLSKEQICKGIETVEAVGGRSNIIKMADKTIVDDCYNANPVSMRAAIDLLMMAKGRKVALLGDMFELGENSDQMHFGVGEYAAKSGVDAIVCVGEKSAHMYSGACKAQQENGTAGEIHYFATRDELLAALPGLWKADDTILIKASHGMGFDKVVAALQESGL